MASRITHNFLSLYSSSRTDIKRFFIDRGSFVHPPPILHEKKLSRGQRGRGEKKRKERKRKGRE
jgi:hypothetical protein